VKKLNQRGFATLEIICVILIISILTTTAVPQMARMIDSARLDYEMKTFLNHLQTARALNRNSHYIPEIFSDVPELSESGHQISLQIDYVKGTYQITKNFKGVSEMHELPAGFSIAKNASLNDPIKFENENNGHITITSRYGLKRYIIFNSVGRWRGSNEPPQ